ncbi:MAG TPA: peptidase domain-containing ABC transporter [Woeseiaceae bacterium]|nr:peptidase domain-containing ABC transporter [Woeseiaceae bacterium]
MKPQSAAAPWLRFRRGRTLAIVRQSTSTECGLACVAMLAGYYGIAADLGLLRRQHEVSLKGATLASIDRCCRELGLATRAIRCGFRELNKLKKPCILHWRFNHFVVLKSVGPRGLTLFDPARGIVTESEAVAREAFTGIALEVSPKTRIQHAVVPRQLGLVNLVARGTGLGQKFLAGFLLALICELLLLTSPFYLQIVIDEVLARGDRVLLNVVAIAFAVLMLLQLLANTMRQLTFLFLGHVTSFDITARVLHRLFRLPIRFFRSRELGDIQHRIQSLHFIQSFIVQGIPALLLDAIFVVMICSLLVLYEARLTLLMLFALVLWCVWRAIILLQSLRLSNDIAQSESSVQTHFLESLRAVQSIKVGNGESQREMEWQNLFANATNARIRLGTLQTADNAVRTFLFQGARIIAIYWLARRGLMQQMTIGAISAYVAYLGMFTTRCAGIVDRVLEYRLLDVPLGRLSDVIFAEEERDTGCEVRSPIGQIELKNVSFAYSRDDPPILNRCSALFRESALTVIAGPSGCGKSTLLQTIAGNETPGEGEILIGGKPAAQLNLKSLRSNMATVFQDDVLLKGSVAENIAVFSNDIDMQRVRVAASAACIAKELESLPMAYETRIGDLSSSLSCGQVQRVLLARAFYRRPSLLLLDEASSGLDAAVERRVIASIKRLPATKILVSHSDLVLQAADEVLWLHNGRLLSSPPALHE